MTSRLHSILLWFWIFIIPLAFNVWGLDPALYSKFFLLDCSLLLTTIILAIQGKPDYKVSKGTLQFISVYILYIFFSVVSLVSYKVNAADGWFGWLHLFTLPVFVLLLLQIDTIITIRRGQVAFAISAMAGVAIVIGLIQYGIAVATTYYWHLSLSDAIRATFAHKNIFAEVLLLTFPFSIYLGFTDAKNRILAKIISVCTLLMIIMLLSRAVWIGMIAALLVTICIYYIANGKLKIKWYYATVTIMSWGLCYVCYRWFIRHTEAGDYLAYFYNQRDTVKERKHLWLATWQIIKLHPVIGSGLGSWKVLNMRYGIVGLRNYATFFQQPHNDYLWVLSEQGILALTTAGMAWIIVMYTLIKKIFTKPSDLFLYTLLFALTAYGIYANLTFPRERAEHCIILSFVTFFVLSAEDKKNIVISRYTFWPLCIILALCAWWSGNKMINEVHLRNYFVARSNNDIAVQRKNLQAISPAYYTLDGTATPIAWYRGMLNFTQGNVTEAESDFDEALKANPYHLYSLCNAATCRNLRGDKMAAERYFRLALEYAPGFPDAALNLCAIKYNEGKIDSAAIYLGMVNDNIENTRYKKSLDIISQAVIQPILDSLGGYEDEVLRKKITSLSKKYQWQADIFKKAYICNRPIKKQVLMDMIWSIKYDDRDSVKAQEYQRKLNTEL